MDNVLVVIIGEIVEAFILQWFTMMMMRASPKFLFTCNWILMPETSGSGTWLLEL